MSKVLIALKAPSKCASYLTAGKQYDIVEMKTPLDKFGNASVTIIDDTGELLNTRIMSSAHLGKDAKGCFEKVFKKEEKQKLKKSCLGFKY